MIDNMVLSQEEKYIIEMMEKIEDYILGQLTQEEIDELWMEFLKAPMWMSFLEIELSLRSMSAKIN